jgi:hypothetical protein
MINILNTVVTAQSGQTASMDTSADMPEMEYAADSMSYTPLVEPWFLQRFHEAILSSPTLITTCRITAVVGSSIGSASERASACPGCGMQLAATVDITAGGINER